MDIDLLKVVKEYEQRGIDALFQGQANKAQWIWGGNYLRIDYRDGVGKIMDTHPHVEMLIKRLIQSNLTVKQQKDILHGCEHPVALKYLECIQQNAQIDQIITDGVVIDEYLRF